MNSQLDKLNLLDRCIDGKIDNLNELLDVAFDHFNVFYKICKEEVGARNISNVTYKGISDMIAKFDIICIDRDCDTSLLISDGMIINDAKTTVERTPGGISLNISLREE